MKPLLVHAALLISTSLGAAELPWQREMPLREAARDAVLTSTLDPQQPTQGANVGRLTLSNAQVRSSVWGPSNRVTLSLLKTDVWDRRYGIAPTLTLAEIREGVFSPANKGFDDMPPNQRRPVRGWLPPEGGGRVDRYACWNAYPFPCQKPVGQIILGLDELAGIPNPPLTQSCADGIVRLQLAKESGRADLEILLSMTRNVYAIRGKLTGVGAPWLRLYRHEDQAWRRYMNADKKTFHERTPGAASGPIALGEVRPTQVPFDYAKDAAWNGPVQPPTSGTDGKYFWIHQRLPAEKTFPQGFDYVLMGIVVGKTKIETAVGKTGLGTPPFGVRGETQQRLEDGYQPIREASGAAATAALTPDANGNVVAYVTVVTCNDAADPFAEARRQLDAAVADGFDKLAAENAAWYAQLYDRREEGRVFYGDASNSRTATDSVTDAFSSWTIRHGGSNQPDMRRFEATASYSNVEQDWQLWHSLPCYNEIFYTANFVRNRGDATGMWWKIIDAWRDAARANAREVYGVPEGMALVHGYIPPIKPDRYVHTNVALEFCVETIAQMVKVLWEQWDYGADENFLRQKAYPALRDTALFYQHYATKGSDGWYHFIPSIEAEAWGFFPEFARGKDSISSLCMARWAFLRAAEAAAILNVDAELRGRWRELADNLAPLPTFETKAGVIFNAVPGTEPSWKPGDHGWYIGFYPTNLADEINLDSPAELRAQMIRTVAAVPSPRGREVLMLLGASRRGGNAGEADVNPAGGGNFGGRAPEALLNSRSGRLHLFPDVAPGETVAFHHFQARGGFLVSAAKAKDGVTFLEIESRRDIRCQVMNPWRDSAVEVRDATSGATVDSTLDRTNGECVVFATRAGGRYLLSRRAAP